MSTNSWSVSAPSSWWSRMMKMATLCSEPSKSSTESLSFLSCIKLDISTDSVGLTSESPAAALYVDATEKCEFSGTTSTMLSVKEFSHALSSLPQGGGIVVSSHDDAQRVTVETNDGAVSFTVAKISIVDEDMTPQPPVVDDKIKTVPVSFGELSEFYKTGSSMSRAIIGNESIGYDPFSGAVVNVKNGSVQVFSISDSAVESFMEVEKQGKKRIAETCISSPYATSVRVDAFAAYVSEGTLGIASTGSLILDGGGAVMSITPLNTGSIKNKALSYDNILSVLSPSWKKRSVEVTASASEFFPSLTRAASVSEDNVKIIVHDTTVTVHGVDGRTTDYPFTQELSVETQWLDDGEHAIEFLIKPHLMKQVGSFIPKDEEVFFSVSLNEGGSPWAMLVHDENFDPKAPHNFFLLFIQ